MLPLPVEEAIRGIAEDRTSGASKLGRLALDVMGLAIIEAKGQPEPHMLAEVARGLSDAQPAMVIVHNVAHLVERLVVEGQDPRTVLAEVACELETASERIARTFLKIAPDHATIITLSFSENVLATLRLAHAKGRVDRIHVLESAPGFEGRSFGRALAKEGLPVTVVGDETGPSLLTEASCALVGADSILRDGSVVNKIGTEPLARTATERGKPFFVAGETLKFDSRYDESSWPTSWASSPGTGPARARLFDVTPARFVTTVVTERGTYTPDIIATMLSSRRGD